MRLPKVPDEEQGTTERILAAAIDLFARDGYARTTVRQIAERAGVSPGLVIHRFGDKEKLRDACDDAVLAEITELQETELGRAASPRAADSRLHRLQHDPAMIRLVDYLGQMVMDRTRGADHLFDALVARTREVLGTADRYGRTRGTDDLEAMAVLVAAHSLVEVIWRHQFSRLLGTPDDPGGTARLAGPVLQLYTRGVVDLDRPVAGASRTSPTPTTKE